MDQNVSIELKKVYQSAFLPNANIPHKSICSLKLCKRAQIWNLFPTCVMSFKILIKILTYFYVFYRVSEGAEMGHFHII